VAKGGHGGLGTRLALVVLVAATSCGWNFPEAWNTESGQALSIVWIAVKRKLKSLVLPLLHIH